MGDCIRRNHFDWPCCIDHADAVRLIRRARQECIAHALEEVIPLALDAIGAATSATAAQ